MKAFILAAAVAAASISFAGAAEMKKDTTKLPVVAGKTMSETDMDKITAGEQPSIKGQGIATAIAAGASPSPNSHGNLHGIGRCHHFSC